MNFKFTYLSCFYFGPRANAKYNSFLKLNKFFFIDKHINFLKKYQHNNIEKIIFVVNQTPTDDIDEITSYISMRSEEIPDNIEFVLMFRDNKFFSYGAWNDAIVEDLQHENDESSYYFCLEDDYLPTNENFIFPFVEKCNQETPYVCSKAVVGHSDYRDHPSISNGLFLKSACKNVMTKYNSVFYVNGNTTYENAWRIQQTFYNLFLDMGYEITDILDSHSSPFLCSVTNEIKMFGEEKYEALIGPITS